LIMKRTQRNVFLAGLLVLSLSACSSWGGWKNPFSLGGSTPAAAPASSGTPEGSTEKPATSGNGNGAATTNGQKP
jgi:hypothetical protein